MSEPSTRYTSSALDVVPIAPGGEAEAWGRVQALTRGRLTTWGKNLLRRGLDGHVKAVLVEPQYVCKDYRDLFSNFYSRKFLPRSAFSSRLHFFSDPTVTVKGAVFAPEKYQEGYIGFSVIQPIRERCIGRTMIDPFMLGKSKESFFCLGTKSRAHINGAEYGVSAYPYYSQSKEAMVCAHSALWGVCRYLSERYPYYGEVRPYDLIEMTGATRGRRVPYRSMTYSDYLEILASFGSHPVVVRPRDTGQKDWTKDRESFFDIYAYVESGFPVLASVGEHVTTIIGHTSNQHVGIHAVDTSRFHNSFALVKNFIAVDDNFFPYQLLGYADDPDNYAKIFKRSDYIPSIESIIAAVIPLPEKAFLRPATARKLGYKCFDHVAGKIDAVLKELGTPASEPLVARLFLTSSRRFKERKRLCVMGSLGESPDELSMVPVDLNLPHFVWVMEVAPLSQHNARYAIGEVMFDASSSEDECEFIYMRIGRTLIRGDQESVFDAGRLRFRQYTHNLGEQDG